MSAGWLEPPDSDLWHGTRPLGRCGDHLGCQRPAAAAFVATDELGDSQDLTGVGGIGGGISAKFSSNANTGGICFGDSGGPILTAGTTTIVAVNSYVKNLSCAGTTGGYRIDQADDLAFLATFGITPLISACSLQDASSRARPAFQHRAGSDL